MNKIYNKFLVRLLYMSNSNKYQQINDSSESLWIQRAQLIANDGEANDLFGANVDIDNNYAIVGASWDNNYQGSAYIFERVDGSWIQKQQLFADDGQSEDRFGTNVAIHNNFAIVGAFFDDNKKGSAYIFEKDTNGIWNQKQRLFASDGQNEDRFGSSVDIYNNYAIIGAYVKDNRKGSAYIFEQVNGIWNQKQILVSSDGAPDDYFGSSVAIYNNYTIVGAYYTDNAIGSAYIFEQVNGTWNQMAKLVADDRTQGDTFGYRVNIYNNYAIVGAPQDDINYSRQGSAYIFEQVDGTWNQMAKLVADDGAENSLFGWSVAIDNNYALIGAYGQDSSNIGAAYIFQLDTSWKQLQKIIADDGAGSDSFGYSVAIDNDYAIIGAPFVNNNPKDGHQHHDINYSKQGTANIYEQDD